MIKRVESGRLIFFSFSADSQFWDDQWGAMDKESVYAVAERGELGWFEPYFTRYLPREGRILEAGCGLGQFVVALRSRGYEAEGLDWAAETVDDLKRRYPEIPVARGDATRIACENEAYGGYISLGVIEHQRSGPDDFIKEAHRVLRNDGVALFTVPCFNPLRRLKARLGAYRRSPGDVDFYQYAFSQGEIAGRIQDAGFEIVEVRPFDSYKGLKDEIGVPRFISNGTLAGYDLGALTQRLLSRLSLVERFAGHMVLLVCRKIG